MSYETKAIFLDSEDGINYSKDFGGILFNVTKLEDKTLKVKIGDNETDICSPLENEYGVYFITSLYGGKAFISFRESKKGNGDYCLVKLNAECALPPVQSKGKGKAKAPATKKYASSPW